MPPARKQKNNKIFKTSNSYVHPSLAVRENTSSKSAASEPSPSVSVNERINHLRRTQGQRATPSVVFEELKSRPAPSPLSRRRFAGPPPPRSWLQDDGNERKTFKYGSLSRKWRPDRPNALSYFPGSNIAEVNTLIHHTLKAIAKHFDWHAEYDHIYLSVLPVELKEILLSYIALDGPDSGVDVAALKILFLDSNLTVGSTSNESVHRLDLGGSIGRAFTIKQLEKFLYIKSKRTSDILLADSWDSESSLVSTARFSQLKMLSLAYPSDSVSWADLLSLSRHLGAITHLSLAHWPKPALPSSPATSASASAAVTSASDISDAAYILRLFARGTPSLQYLSLEGCSKWLQALTHSSPTSSGRRRNVRLTNFELPLRSETDAEGENSMICTSSWRHLTVIDISQGWVPQEVRPQFLFRLYSARSGQDNPSSIQVPMDPLIPAPATTLQPRAFPSLRDTATSSSSSRIISGTAVSLLATAPLPQEHYTVTASASVADSIQAGVRRREWSWHEIDALNVGLRINEARKHAGQKPCSIEYGWDKQDLMDLGYAEVDLFHAGF